MPHFAPANMAAGKKKPTPHRMKNVQLNIRVSDFAKELLERIGFKHGMNKSAALEYAIRAAARAEGLWDIEPTGKH